MRISYRSFRGRYEAVYEQVGILHFCCQEMLDEWDILIGFGVKGHRRTSSREVNIFTSHHIQIGGNCILGVTEIRYCPWCGEEIEVVRVK